MEDWEEQHEEECAMLKIVGEAEDYLSLSTSPAATAASTPFHIHFMVLVFKAIIRLQVYHIESKVLRYSIKTILEILDYSSFFNL